MAATYSYQPANSTQRSQARTTALSRTPVEKPVQPTQDTRMRLLSAVNAMPPLPAVLSQLLGMVNDDDCSSTEIASMIERDSIMAQLDADGLNRTVSDTRRLVARLDEKIRAIGHHRRQPTPDGRIFPSAGPCGGHSGNFNAGQRSASNR